MRAAEAGPKWLGHRERLRLRAEQAGPDALKTREMLELLLFYAVPRADVSELALALEDRFGGVRGLAEASEAELKAVPGMTRGIAKWLKMTFDLLRAWRAVDREKLPRLWRLGDVTEYLAGWQAQVRLPECWMIYTDAADRLITRIPVSDSLYWMDPAIMRRIVGDALALEARHAVLALFSGDIPHEIEEEECEFIAAFASMMREIEVELLDCVVVGGGRLYSLNADGRMAKMRAFSNAPGLHERYVRGDEDGGEAEG